MHSPVKSVSEPCAGATDNDGFSQSHEASDLSLSLTKKLIPFG